jgi:5S rRNA maturation endonuclease (ribonuclease M5)
MVDGDRAGIWKDFATGDGGSNLLELLFKKFGGEFGDACKKAEDWLGVSSFGPSQGAKSKTCGEDKKPNKVDCGDLSHGSDEDYQKLARLYGLSVESLLVGISYSPIYFFTHPINGRCWCVVDPGKHVRQDRRLDGKPFVLGDGSEAKARTIGNPSWPVGYLHECTHVVFCEGSTDLLAAKQLIYDENLNSDFAPAAMLGASNGIHPDALPQFEYKNVLIFPDYDAAGMTAAKRWESQLREYANSVKIFDFGGLTREDGKPIKDLRDFLAVDADKWDSDYEIRTSLGNFMGKKFPTRLSFRLYNNRKEQRALNQTKPINHFNSERALICR